MIDRQNVFDQPIRNNLIIYDNIQNVSVGQEIIIQLLVCWTIIISKNIR